jgi:hypothetical protein
VKLIVYCRYSINFDFVQIPTQFPYILRTVIIKSQTIPWAIQQKFLVKIISHQNAIDQSWHYLGMSTRSVKNLSKFVECPTFCRSWDQNKLLLRLMSQELSPACASTFMWCRILLHFKLQTMCMNTLASRFVVACPHY